MSCRMHGHAFTSGCPGCEANDDQDIVDIVRCSRLRWWKIPNLCNRLGHFYKTIEPGVMECRVCGTALFTDVTEAQLERWLKR